MSEMILIHTVCLSCGCAVSIKINSKFVGKNNKPNHGVYCNECRHKRQRQRSGRTSEKLNELHKKKLSKSDQVKVLTKEEIASVEATLTKPVQRKRCGNFVIRV